MERVHKFVLQQQKIQLDELKKYGEDYDKVTSSIYEKGRTKTSLSFKAGKVELDIGAIDNYREHFMLISDPVNALGKQLADLALKNSTFGDTLDLVSNKSQTLNDQITLVKSSMDTLWNQGVRPGNDTIKVAGMSIDQYTAKLKDLYLQQKLMEMQSQSMQIMYSTLGSAVGDLAIEFGKLLAGSQDAWMAMVDIVLQSAQSMVTALLGIAIMAKLMWGAVLFPIGGLVMAAVGIGALMAAWQGYKASSAKMAAGGIVPPGFPNDSYNANLTSGEIVVPPGKLDGIMNQNSEWDKEVILRVKGYDLEAVLRKQVKKLKKV
jgi:hypothetical protein